ncbi:MAG TPA: hypothetical protein VM491_10585 [Burkholderiaceae bacterium]|jgi:hypothetical protein|nr:hypothetical protein [Burkholderiaceae bacterium]
MQVTSKTQPVFPAKRATAEPAPEFWAPSDLLDCAHENADILLSFLLGVLIAIGLVGMYVGASMLLVAQTLR